MNINFCIGSVFLIDLLSINLGVLNLLIIYNVLDTSPAILIFCIVVSIHTNYVLILYKINLNKLLNWACSYKKFFYSWLYFIDTYFLNMSFWFLDVHRILMVYILNFDDRLDVNQSVCKKMSRTRNEMLDLSNETMIKIFPRLIYRDRTNLSITCLSWWLGKISIFVAIVGFSNARVWCECNKSARLLMYWF